MASEPRTDDRLDRACANYRRVLIAYPRSFRDEYGDDLVQTFRDLLLMSGERGVWWRTVRDLFVSVPREQVAALRGGKRPSPWSVAMLLVLLVALAVIGTGAPEVFATCAALIVLPAYGINRLHRAWFVRRTTGDPIAGLVIFGGGLFIPSVIWLALAGPDRGFWIVVTIILLIILGCAFGVIAGVTALVAARRSGERTPRVAIWAAIAGVVIVGGMVGAAYNSYRNSQPPPGDHSVAKASAETRALWAAADTGDVETVKRLARTCADPWVQFPTADGKHDARGAADARLLELPDDQEPPYAEIKAILGPAKSSWYERCGGSAAEK